MLDTELLVDDIDIKKSESGFRDTQGIENEMQSFMKTEEGEKIKADIELLNNMGYEKTMINKVYILLHPENIERAIDYMTETNGIYQHNFFESHNPKKDLGLCFICKKPKRNHLDYIPEDLLFDIIVEEVQNNNDSFRFSIDDIGKDSIKNENKKLILNECNVCFDEVQDEEKKFNALPCGHICCTQCWLNYLKTLITEAKVEKIKCVDHQCKEIISEDFILKHINEDQKLVEKYQKFKKRAEIINDPNKKQCPNPDCESFLEKSSKTNYVKCQNGHEYCFECLKPPHGKSRCDEIMEKDFMKWKKHKRVKRCPRCKMYTEKNEGCNHMTCISCKYQWCWLCEGAYSYGHYNSGKCQGHQFTRADNVKQARRRICCISLHTCFPCFFKKVNRTLNVEYLWLAYLCIFLYWFFGFFIFAGYSILDFADHKISFDWSEKLFYVFGFAIVISLFVCYQIIFTCLLTPFILLAIVYPPFLDNIASFFNINF